MPRISAGPKLFKKKSRTSDQWYWYIRDGKKQIATGILVENSRKSEEAAREALRDYLTDEAKKEPDIGPSDWLVSQVVEYYVSRRGDEVSAAETMYYTLKPILTFFGPKIANKLTPDDGFQYTKWRMHKPKPAESDWPAYPRLVVKGPTVRRELLILNAALAIALKAEKISRKVSFDLPPASTPKERWLTVPEAARLLMGALGFIMVECADIKTRQKRWLVWRRERRAAVSKHVARFVLIGLYTGTRHAAICELGFEPHPAGGHFDLAQGLMYRKTAEAGQTSKRKPTIPLDKRLAPFVRRWKRLSASNFVVDYRSPTERHGDDGQEIGGLDDIGSGFALAVKRAGLGPDVTPHVLRHTCTTWLLQRGWSIWDTAGYVGMSLAIVEKVYGHHSAEFMKSAGKGVR